MEIVEQKTEVTAKVITYRELKLAMDSEMKKTEESFVRIGYLFRLAMETDILKNSGYTSYLEFAEKEYGMDKSQVSRFINIHEKFSDPQDPTRLRAQYQGFGHSKLALMLTLPDTIIEEISPAYSKSEIKQVKEELEAEKKTTDLELLIERKEAAETGEQPDILHQVINELLDTDIYMRIKLRQALKSVRKEALIQEILAPSGEAMHSVRIKGVGRLMLSVKGLDTEIALINVRSNSKEVYPWIAVIEAVEDYCEKHADPEPGKKPEVAPVQPIEKRTEKRKLSKVTRARETEKKPDPQEDKTELGAPSMSAAINAIEYQAFKQAAEISDGKNGEQDIQVTDEQLEGQMRIEQFPEYLPEAYVKCHDGSEITEEDAQKNHIEMLCEPVVEYLKRVEKPYIIKITSSGVLVQMEG